MRPGALQQRGTLGQLAGVGGGDQRSRAGEGAALHVAATGERHHLRTGHAEVGGGPRGGGRRGVGLPLGSEVGGLGGLVLVERDEGGGPGVVDGVLRGHQLTGQLADAFLHGVGPGLRGGDLGVAGPARYGSGGRQGQADARATTTATPPIHAVLRTQLGRATAPPSRPAFRGRGSAFRCPPMRPLPARPPPGSAPLDTAPGRAPPWSGSASCEVPLRPSHPWSETTRSGGPRAAGREQVTCWSGRPSGAPRRAWGEGRSFVS